MKILSKMLSKKIDPQDAGDFDREAESLALDDAGQVRRSREATDDAPIAAKPEEPEVAGSGWGQADDWDDDWDDDEDWGAEDDLDVDMETRRMTQDKEHLVSEIREAVVSVSHTRPDQPEDELPEAFAAPTSEWVDDEDFGRRARARSQLTDTGGATEDRLLEQTENVMSDQATSRRRSAMAHLKAAAAATKADRVLRHVASRDPSADPEEQSPYRDDLAKVVRPHSTSRPISRVVSRPNAASPVWDQGEADADAALFAAAEDGVREDPALSVENEMAAAEEARVARTASELTAADFAEDDDGYAFEDSAFEEEEDDGFVARSATRSEFPSSKFAFEEPSTDELDRSAFEEMDETPEETDAEVYDFDAENDEDGPRPSSVVSEAVAFANATDEELDELPEGSVRKKIWEMAEDVDPSRDLLDHDAARAEMPDPHAHDSETHIEDLSEVSSAVIAGRAGRSAGRVKTRLLGFQSDDEATDVFASAAQKANLAPDTVEMFPSGWIVVIDGPGRGASFALQNGVSQLGRGEDQTVRLDFGDTSISRDTHAAVAYDDETGKFYLGHGGKSNLVRLNGMPVLSTEEMTNGDEIRIGETLLKFVALCGDAFTWSGNGDDGENA
jgi:hypothetical protein